MREKTTQYVLLGILAEAGPSSGYDVRHWIDQAIGHFWSESFGQIYPELHRLLDAGLVERADEGEGPRDQKVYRITAAGREALQAWLAVPPRPDRRRSELLLKLFLGRFNDEQCARHSLEEARREASARLAFLEGAQRQVLVDDADSPGLPYFLITIDAGRRAARARIEWAEAALRTLDLYENAGAEAVCAALEEEQS